MWHNQSYAQHVRMRAIRPPEAAPRRPLGGIRVEGATTMAGWQGSDRSRRLPANWRRLRAGVLKRDGWLCQIGGPDCQRLATQVDHIEPGDDHSFDNLQAVCARCHASKSAGEGIEARAAIQARGRRPTEQHPGLCED